MSAAAASEFDHEPPARTDRPRHRRRRTRRPRRRTWLLLLAFAALVIAVAAGWLLYTGLRARSELEAVRSEVHSLRTEINAGDLAAARATAQSLRSHALEAHSLTTGPVWAASAHIPLLGRPLEAVRAISSDVDAISGSALPELVSASSQLDPASLRRPDGRFDIAPIRAAAPAIDSAARTMQGALTGITASPSNTWLGAVDSARADLLDQLQPLTRAISNASVAADTLPEMLGGNGPRTYLVAFQGEAETRGTGGLVGALATLTADHGTLHFGRFVSDTKLSGVRSGLDFGNDYTYLYSPTAEPTDVFADNNVSPNFPYAARLWLAEWRRKTGQSLDGAITLDPSALSYMLTVAGPVTLPDGTSVTSTNVVRLTQQTAYQRFAHANRKRKRYLLEIAKAASTELIGTSGTTGLVQAAARAVAEHRLLVWTANPTVEARLASSPIGGVVPDSAAPYVGLAVNSAVAGKLDYYLHAGLTVTRASCGRAEQVTATITLRNAAPADLPRYVIAGTTQKNYPAPPGTNRLAVLYYATRGASFDSATLNGKRELLRSGLERNHPVFGATLYLPRNRTQTLVIHMTEPARTEPLQSRIQPLIHPVKYTVKASSCEQ